MRAVFLYRRSIFFSQRARLILRIIKGTTALSNLSVVKTAKPSRPASKKAKSAAASTLLGTILSLLDDAKAEDVVALDLGGQSSLADHMVVATGRSDRHVGAVAHQLVDALKLKGHGGIRVEGLEACEWVLVDAGDVIVHIFKPDARAFYNIERLWGADRPKEELPV